MGASLIFLESVRGRLGAEHPGHDGEQAEKRSPELHDEVLNQGTLSRNDESIGQKDPSALMVGNKSRCQIVN